MERKNLKKLKGLLYGMGLGLLSVNLSGCVKTVNAEDIIGSLKENAYCQKNVGFLKVNEQVIPYYYYAANFFRDPWGYYSYESGAFLGDLYKKNIILDHDILYTFEQVIPFLECNPNVEYNYATIQDFTEETYQNLEESYFASHSFSSKNLKVYEILNLTTNEVNYVIGRKVNGTKVFNFETYMIEDYTGYAIKDMEVEFEQKAYYYSEILEIIKSYRENEKGMILERK